MKTPELFAEYREPQLSAAMDSFLYARSDKVHVEAGRALPPRRGPRRNVALTQTPICAC